MERRSILAASIAAAISAPAQAATPAGHAAFDASVVKRALATGITPRVAADCMKLRANLRNMKQVGFLPLSVQVAAMLGKPQRLTEVYLFCDPVTAIEMVASDIDFAAYLPCRITLTEDAAGKYWLVMLNLAPLIAQIPLGSPLLPKATKVAAILNSIMDAGATGAL